MISNACLIIVLCALAGTHTTDSAEPPTDRVLLRRAVSADAELVIVRGPEIPAEIAAPLLTESRRNQLDRLYDVRVELHGKGVEPIVIGTVLAGFPKPGDGRADPNLRVIEAIVHPGEVIVVIYGSGELGAYRWDFTGGFGCRAAVANLRGSYWSMFAHPAGEDPEEIHVKLTRMPDETWRIDVEHDIPSAVRSTTFEQVEGSWEFRVTRRDMVRKPDGERPTTQPATPR